MSPKKFALHLASALLAGMVPGAPAAAEATSSRHLGAVTPCGTIEEDGSYQARTGIGVQLAADSGCETDFYGLGVALCPPRSALFRAVNFYGIFVGWYAELENVYGMQLALANLGGKNSWFFGCPNGGNCYGLQAGLGNVSESATFQLGPILNQTRETGSVQIGGIFNQSDRLYGLQLALINRLIQYGCGLQAGVVNALQAGPDYDSGDLVQLGLANGATLQTFLQIGVWNTAEDGAKLQLGVWNEASRGGWQIGLLNFSEHAWVPFFPLLLYTPPPEGVRWRIISGH